MADTSILREYLVSLGFHVDQSSNKKFVGTLEKLNANAFFLTKNIENAAVAVKAMVQAFSSQMEKLYFSSRKAESTVQQMQALEYAAKQVGVSGDTMKGAIEGMARAMRSNPGLQGLLHSMGVRTEGRTVAQEMVDMIKQLRSLPFSVGSRYAEMFGIDADTYLLLSQSVDKLEEAARVREKMNESAGLDIDQAAKQGTHFSQQLTTIGAQFETIFQSLSNDAMPVLIHVADVISKALDDVLRIIGYFHGKAMPKSPYEIPGTERKATSFWDFISKPLYLGKPFTAPGGAQSPAPASAPTLPAISAPAPVLPATGAGGGRGSSNPALVTDSKDSKLAKLAALEKKYGLPSGVLASMWQQESGQGVNLYNAKSKAEGDFQFIPSSAKEFGVDVKSFDSSAEGAARKLSGELKQFGDLGTALQAYNLGEGNLSKVMLGQKAMPAETAKYGNEIMTRAGITQTNNITVSGVSDPAKAANAVQDSIQLANSELIRSGKIKVY